MNNYTVGSKIEYMLENFDRCPLKKVIIIAWNTSFVL